MNIVKLRGAISLLLLLFFIIVFFSGLGLHFAPSSRIARETGWTFFGFDKGTLQSIHTLPSFLMSFLIAIHFALNYKMLLCELKLLFKRK